MNREEALCRCGHTHDCHTFNVFRMEGPCDSCECEAYNGDEVTW